MTFSIGLSNWRGCIITVGDERRGNPALIAVSSFGEGLRRVTPPHRPGGGTVKESARRTPRALFVPLNGRRYPAIAGKTTVNVVPSPRRESTQIRPWWLSTMDFTMERPNPVPGSPSGTLLARKNLSNK